MISITEYADIINVEIVIRYYPNQDTRFSASFERAEVMEGGCLAGFHGNGKSPKEAVDDCLSQIKGKRIAIGAYTDNRREFVVPVSIVGLEDRF